MRCARGGRGRRAAGRRSPRTRAPANRRVRHLKKARATLRWPPRRSGETLWTSPAPAAMLRTGDEPWTAAEHTTYVGVQVHGMLIFGVGGRVGFMRRISHADNTQHDTIVPVGLSIGY